MRAFDEAACRVDWYCGGDGQLEELEIGRAHSGFVNSSPLELQRNWNYPPQFKIDIVKFLATLRTDLARKLSNIDLELVECKCIANIVISGG